MVSQMYAQCSVLVLFICVFYTVSKNACPKDEHDCRQEGCVSQELKCMHTICPYSKPIECRDKRKCYTKEQQCNKIGDCLDYSDEYRCGESTDSPYYASNASRIEGELSGNDATLAKWVIALVVTAVLLVFISLMALAYVYCYLKCRLLHDQIAYDEKHKFMEEHGEMPSNGPVMSGIRPPADGWKYVCRSVYAQEEQSAEDNTPENDSKDVTGGEKASPGNCHVGFPETPKEPPKEPSKEPSNHV